MTDFTFTVRATDNAGAFADRNFSLTVNDTATSSVFDRFVIAGSGGIARSPDGVTWSSVDTSIAGWNSVVYGNNTWVLYNSNQSGSIRVANASSMVFAPAYAPTIVGTPASRSFYYFSSIIYRKGAWYALAASLNTGSQYSLEEYSSTDLKTFTWRSTVFNSYSVNLTNVAGYDYDPVKDVWVTHHSSIIFRRSGNGAWQVAASLNNSSPTTYNGGTVLFKNGLWVVSNPGNPSFATSLDGVNFVTRPGLPSSIPSLFSYQNGRLLLSPMNNVGGNSLSAFESLNGGRTLAQRGSARTNYPQAYGLGSYLSRSQIATYAGRTVVISPGYNNNVYQSNDDLLTNTSNTTLVGLGTPYSIAVRDN